MRETQRAESELTFHWVFNHGASLARTLNLENFIHEHDPTVAERTTPVRDKPLEHSSWPALLRHLQEDLATQHILGAYEHLSNDTE